jgi:hypothetical protein
MASTIPITRSTPAARLATFNANSTSLYNKYSPYTSYSIGPSQPFIYTHISDSNISRNLTKYDTQALPIGSTARDLKRVGQYMITGNGLLYTGKQLLLQKSNAFNETRIYNPLSLLKATAKPGSTGLIDYPQRHLETSGGILNFFKDALMSTLGMQSNNLQQSSIEGTATGPTTYDSAYSTYVSKHGGARAGLVRYNTAIQASTKFDTIWVSNKKNEGGGGGFLANLGKALVNKLISFIPSTNPLGAFGGDVNSWIYRPEYPNNGKGIYFKFLEDKDFLSTSTKNIYYRKYYNNGLNNSTDAIISNVYDFHKYSPEKATSYGNAYPTVKGNLYAGLNQITNGELEYRQFGTNRSNNIETMLKNIVRDSTAVNTKPQLKRSAEMYKKVRDNKGIYYPTYEDIPSQNPKSGDPKFYDQMKDGTNIIKLDDRMFSKVSKYNISKLNGIELDPSDAHDEYNAYDIDVLSGKKGTIPEQLTIGDQSKDIIFFYFFDLINEVYIPFRATISSLSDQHSADWEDINYLGRADKLFLYKGFSRDVSFSFTVYANSAKEMLPMWNRVNYLVGLTKPSKYTGKAEVTNEFATSTSTGKESRFMYPPMVTLRLGDLFYDQPCVISSVGVNVPDDTNWESLRAEEYYYYASPLYKIVDKAKSRQLPMKVDVSVQLKLMEKRLARGSDGHYGNSDGKDWKL